MLQCILGGCMRLVVFALILMAGAGGFYLYQNREEVYGQSSDLPRGCVGEIENPDKTLLCDEAHKVSMRVTDGACHKVRLHVAKHAEIYTRVPGAVEMVRVVKGDGTQVCARGPHPIIEVWAKAIP